MQVYPQQAWLMHVVFLPQVKLAKKLVESSFADKVFFCNSGTEANEAAIKFSRKYARKAGERPPLECSILLAYKYAAILLSGCADHPVIACFARVLHRLTVQLPKHG